MKKNFWGFAGMLAILFSVSAENTFAVGMIQSGVDLNTSQIQIQYTKYSFDTHTTFECFGDIVNLDQGGSDPDGIDTATISKSLNDSNVLTEFSSDINGTQRFSFQDLADNESAELNILDPSNPSLRNCFQQAGVYRVSVILSDSAGNVNTPTPIVFQIRATNPDQNETHTTDRNATCNENTYANGQDTCQLYVEFKDKFKNKVANLNGEEVFIYKDDSVASNPWSDDANIGTTKFYEGLFIDPDSGDPREQMHQTNVFNSIAHDIEPGGEIILNMGSYAPTLRDNGNYWQELVTRNFPIDIQVSSINPNGSANSGNIITLDAVEIPIIAAPPVQINPEIIVGTGDGTNGSFLSLTETNANAGNPDCGDPNANNNTVCPEWNQGQIAKVKFLQNSPGFNYDGDDPSQPNIPAITGKITRFSYPGDIPGTYKYKTQYQYKRQETVAPFTINDTNVFVDENPYSTNLPFFPGIGSAENNAINLSYDIGDETAQGEFDVNAPDYTDSRDLNYVYFWKFIPPAAGEWLQRTANKALEIKTIAEYSLNGHSISYYAGNYGFSQGDNELDILIEGVVTGDSEKIVVLEDLIKIGKSNTSNTRKTITQNAFNLVRGNRNAIKTSVAWAEDIEDAFENTNVVVVDGSNINGSNEKISVTIGNNPLDTIELPQGKNTLIIVDGNLLIQSNLEYINADDSFGVILVNSLGEGNRVDSALNTYPDTGNIFVHSDVKSIIGSYFADGGIMTQDAIPSGVNKFANVVHDSYKQLRLTGYLLSKNTIGGTLAPDANNKYITPWGKIDATAGREIAERYDLRKLRTYSYDENDYNMKLNGSGREDGHPFILRFDRKSSELSPPGFGSAASIGQ